MNKYEIAKQVEQEDTLNAIECLGYDIIGITEDDIIEMGFAPMDDEE